MTSPLALVQSDDLPLVGDVIVSDLAIEPTRSLGWSLQRAAIIQFDTAIGALTDQGLDPPTGIHEARKATKRIRAILRLIRGEIGRKVYRYENRSIRDAARLLSPARTSHVATETLDGLIARYGPRLSGGTFVDVTDRLRDRAESIGDDTIASGTGSDFVRAMRFGRARFASWSVEPNGASPYRGHIRDGFDVLTPGLIRTYRRGRDAMDRAVTAPTVTNLHQWRKRVKYLRHQTEVLAPIWPEVVGGLSVAVDRLGDILGHDHDLADLVRLVTVKPELCPDALDRSLLGALAQHDRSAAQRAAYVSGARIYAEAPEAFAGRLGSYWIALEMAVEDPPHPA